MRTDAGLQAKAGENKMGVLPVGRLLAGMAVPMMISMLVQALYNIVDSVFVSRLSENALTAVSLAFPLQNLMIAVGAGTAVGMNALLSRALGAKEQERADQTANTGIFLALCSFAVFCVLGLTFSHTFFQLQTNVEEIVTAGTAYAGQELPHRLHAHFVFRRGSRGRDGLIWHRLRSHSSFYKKGKNKW